MPRQKGAARRKEREVLGAIKAQHRARLEKDIYGPKAKAPPPKITEATRARFGMLVCMVACPVPLMPRTVNGTGHAAYTCATFANGLFAGVLLSGGMQGSPVVREYLSRWGWGLGAPRPSEVLVSVLAQDHRTAGAQQGAARVCLLRRAGHNNGADVLRLRAVPRAPVLFAAVPARALDRRPQGRVRARTQVKRNYTHRLEGDLTCCSCLLR